MLCNVCFISGLFKAARICDWPQNTHCKSGDGGLKPDDLPTVRPSSPPTKPTLPPTWSAQSTLSSSGEVISSTPSLPTVETTRPPQGGTLSGNYVFILLIQPVCGISCVGE